MSESKRVPFTQVFTVLIVSVIMGTSLSFSQEASTPLPPGYSPQREKERIDAALKRMSEPAGRRERQLCDDLGSVLQRYWADKSPSLREECESLLGKTLALPKPEAKTFSLCATAANALDRPRQAIEILKKAIAEYPEEHAWGLIMPLRIAGRFRIAAIAARIGDANEAVQAYETILASRDDLESRRLTDFLCRMHLAEILRPIPGREQRATAHLQEAVRIAEGFGVGATRGDEILNAQLLKGWAAYEWARLRPDEASGDLGPDPNALPSRSSCWMFAMVWASISCPSMPEMELMAESGSPSTVRVLAGLGLATIYIEDSNLNPPKAKKYLLPIADGDSYFKPYAKATLALVYGQTEEIREKIPLLLNDLKHGNFEQREQAAFSLCHEMGPEGIKALQQAQQDPNKYVRYEAACSLARWGRDPTIKPDFHTILEAFQEEDPRMRGKAQSAIGCVEPCIEIGPKEAIALVRLMNEHCSTELVWTLTDVLFSAKPDIQDAAVAELAPLMNHQSEEVREATVEIYSRIGDSLLQRLEIEEEAMQVKIIGILGRLGPAGRHIAFALTHYAKHDNPNIRNAAAEALKNLSSTGSVQTSEDTQDP